MLCPQCGSEVGEKLELCEKCQNAKALVPAESTENRTAIGAIRPNLKIVRLNRESGQDTPAGQPGDIGSGSDTEPVAIANIQSSNEPSENEPRQPRSFRGVLLALALFSVIGFIGLGGWLLKDQVKTLFSQLPTSLGSDDETQNLKNVIQIRVRPDPNDLETRSKFGYAIVGYTGYAFRSGKAVYSKQSATLSVDLSTEFAKESEPEMRIRFVFTPNSPELSLDRLINFSATLPHEGEVVNFNKVYSPKSIGLNIVPKLNGTLGSKPELKAIFNGSEYRSLSGGGVDFTWKLYLHMPIEVVP